MKLQLPIFAALVISASLLAAPAVAQDENTTDDLDVSLTVVEAGQGAESAINSIELPEQASETARENAAFGLETANEARKKGLEKAAEGQAKAREAREKAARLASEAGSQAQERMKNNVAQGALERVPSDVHDKIPANLPGRAQDAGRDAGSAAANARAAAETAGD